MTQEEKQLLLKDLCGRLPYGVKVAYTALSDNMPKVWDVIGLPAVGLVDIVVPGKYRFAAVSVEEIKPYLRPMSSMTEKEYNEYDKATDLDVADSSETLKENLKAKIRVRVSKWYHGADWLNAHHFDHRGLIEKELALEAPANMYKND